MKQIRKRFTYANVMSSIAVFLVLGGATAFAASHLGKNSVGTKQLKKNSVTVAKIKKNAVTAAKIRNHAVTGAKLDVGTIPTVPSASSAGNANAVGGQSAVKLFKTLTQGESDVLVASVAGFDFVATCDTDDVNLKVVASASTAWAMEAGGVPGNVSRETTDSYNAGGAGESGLINVDELTEGGDATFGTATFYGAKSDGTIVSGDLGYDYETFNGIPADTCLVAGHLLVG